MTDPSPYLNGLHPWYGFGGHPEVTEPDMFFVPGKAHDYRTRKLGDGDFLAEQRPRGGEWQELSRGHKNAYIAGSACVRAEGLALQGRSGGEPEAPPEAAPSTQAQEDAWTHLPRTGRMPSSEPNMANEPKKLSGLERLRLQREQKK